MLLCKVGCVNLKGMEVTLVKLKEEEEEEEEDLAFYFVLHFKILTACRWSH
jgi:hypothetical protein